MKKRKISASLKRPVTVSALLLLLVPVVSYSRASSVETIQLRSTLVNATLPYNVILPPDYRASSVTRYPVLYLLHGLTGHYTDWVTKTNVADYAGQYRIIVVMPEGKDGWYADSATVPTDKYESYILKELFLMCSGAIARLKLATGAASRACRWAATARSSLA